jgi:SAM-dependent methyltransferase
MAIPADHDQNADQIAFWNGPAGQRWTDRQQAQDTMLAPVSGILIDRAGAKAGERIVDVGCGCGATTLALAQKVGPTGHVFGIDISAPMLGRARQIAPPGLPVDFALADATIYPFVTGSFDLLVSRFGVMFFAEPVLSFANMRRALRPSGRLAFAWLARAARKPLDDDVASGGLPTRPKAAPAWTGRPRSILIRVGTARDRDIERGRVFRDSHGAVRSLARCSGRARSRGGGGIRARNRSGGPCAGGPAT